MVYYCTLQEAWNTNEIPEMKYYKEMPMPPITPSNMYGYNQIEMYGDNGSAQQGSNVSGNEVAHIASTDTDIVPYQNAQRTTTDMKYLRNLSNRGGNGAPVIDTDSTGATSSMTEYKKLVDELKKENSELKAKLKDAESRSSSDGMLDVIMYISGGVFLLFFMEHITSSARRF